MRRLTRRSFTAAGIIFAASLATGCFDADDNVPETVYGPPADDQTEPVAYDPSKNETQVVYGPPPDDFDARENALDVVYGPPSDGFDAWENVAVDVYGPPSEEDPWT